MGIDRRLFSPDKPDEHSPDGPARSFLAQAPRSGDDQANSGPLHAERLRKLR